MVSGTELVRDFRSIGLQTGDTVLVHSSLKSLGRVANGPVTVIDALREVVGSTGTVVMPTFVSACQGPRPDFDSRLSPSESGLLTETLRLLPDARRSEHPTHSVAAIGEYRDRITGTHPMSSGPNTPWGRAAFGRSSPFDELYRLNGKVLLLGVGFNRCTMFHYVQVEFLRRHEHETKNAPFPEIDFELLGQRLLREAVIGSGTVGRAGTKTFEAKPAVDRALAILEQDADSVLSAAGTRTRQWVSQRRVIDTDGRLEAAAFITDISPNDGRDIAEPLRARGILLRRGTEQGAVIVCDVILLTLDEVTKIRRAVSEATSIPPDRILVVATHTHSCPRTFLAEATGYLATLPSRIAPAAGEAAANMQPVRVGATCAAAPAIGRNRRVRLTDGQHVTIRWHNPWTWHIPDEQVAGRGPEDVQLPLLYLERLDGSPLAVLAVCSCHNTAALMESRYNPDFFGYAANSVERALGAEAVCCVLPGAVGDIDPTASIVPGGDRLIPYARMLGNRLAARILLGLDDCDVDEIGCLACRSRRIELAARSDWLTLPPWPAHPRLANIRRTGRIDTEITCLAMNRFSLISLPGEFYCQTSLLLNVRAPFENSASVSYANYGLFYLPPASAYAQGGYGVDAGRCSLVVAGTVEELTDLATKLLAQVSRLIAGS